MKLLNAMCKGVSYEIYILYVYVSVKDEHDQIKKNNPLWWDFFGIHSIITSYRWFMWDSWSFVCF